MEKKVRNSSIELLRIIAMVMIIFHHFAVHGGYTWDTTTNLIPRMWINFISMGGKVGVNVFVLITGYYLITSKESIKLDKVLKLVGQLVFYSVGIYLVFVLTGKFDFSIITLIKRCLPITFIQWWFASTYFVLYIFHPYINKLLNSLYCMC